MDVAEFFSEFRRMCKSFNDCTKCQYHGNKCDNANEIFEKTVAVVEKWSQEHPRKTRQSEFLNMCPTARVDAERLPGGCTGAAAQRGIRNELPEAATLETKEGGVEIDG